MKKLNALFCRMQTAMQNYIIPDSYTPQFGELAGKVSHADNSSEERTAFIGDIIYALDSPEQREAQAEASFDYLELSSRTASDKFYGELINDTTLRSALLNFARAAADLDRVKKLLFYGEDKAKGREKDALDLGKENAWFSLGMLSVAARASDDEELSVGGPAHHRAIALLHGVLGVGTESGEMVEALLKAMKGERFDTVNMAEEIGDVQWYEAMLARALGTDFDAIQRGNIDKLIERFKHKFSETEANNRNLAAERVVLDGIRRTEDDDVYPMKADDVVKPLDDGDTFDDEETAAAAQLALSRAEPQTARVHTQLSDFPDEAFPGPDPQDGKYSG